MARAGPKTLGPSPTSSSNRLLRLLHPDDLAALEPHLEPYPLTMGEVILRPDEPVSHVYFVTRGMVSLVKLMASGKYMETGIIGREGMVGALAPLGTSAFTQEAIVQIGGTSLRMRSNILRNQLAVRPALRDLILRYVQALFAQVAQSVVCNSQHDVRQRLARWLAMGSDCIESSHLPLTHELLSRMLGVQRSSVTLALTSLKNEGLITTHQRGVKIVDRRGLQNACCECYGEVRREFRRLLGPSIFQDTTPQTATED